LLLRRRKANRLASIENTFLIFSPHIRRDVAQCPPFVHTMSDYPATLGESLRTTESQRQTATGSVERQKRAISNAMQGARRAATLTQRLLAFARRLPLEPKPVDPNKVVAGAVEFIQRTLGETIDIEAVGGAGLWRVEIDVGQFEAALLNLAINARDAMPNGGKLTIETSNVFLDEDYCLANPEVVRGQYVLVPRRSWSAHLNRFSQTSGEHPSGGAWDRTCRCRPTSLIASGDDGYRFAFMQGIGP
jgi:hypothetical protein